MRLMVMLLSSLFVTANLFAEEEKLGRLRYGMDMGYMRQQKMSDAQASDVSMVVMHFQVQSALVNPSQKGNTLTLITQFTIAEAFTPDNSWIFGLDIMPRFLFWGTEKWRPFVNGGVGFNVFGLHIPELSGNMQFTVLFGGGVELQTSERVAVTLEYRATHFSNNDVSFPNHGINMHTFLVGASIGFPRD